MPSEAYRGIKRISANYGGLLSNLVLGLILVPLLINWVGMEAFGLISLVGASAGIALMVSELTNQSMVRELGAAWHSQDENRFFDTYNSALAVSFGVTILTGLLFIALVGLIHNLRIPPEWVDAARWFIGAQGAYACLLVMLSPAFSMYKIREEFVWVNGWLVVTRATGLTSVLILAYGFGLSDTEQCILAYGILWSGLLCAVSIVAVIIMIIRDPRLWPAPGRIQLAAMKRVIHTFTLNSAVHVGMGLHERLAALLMNLFFGVFGNAVFEIGLRLAAYVKMVTAGTIQGLDAVSARVSEGKQSGAIRALLRHSTRLQAFVAFPAGLAVFLYAEPLLRLWVGRSIEDPDAAIPIAVTIVQILALAITARSLSLGWMFILYGAGHVRQYAPLVLAGGILSPLLGTLLCYLMSDMPPGKSMTAPAIGYAVVFTVIHLLFLPRIGARCLEIRTRDLFTPLLRPALATALCSPILIAPSLIVEHWTLLKLAAVALAFGSVYAIVSWIIVLTPDERKRCTNALRQSMTPRNA